MSGFTLPYEAADAICVAVLKEQLKHLQEEALAHENDGVYMHPEDYALVRGKYIPSLETLIAYFGG